MAHALERIASKRERPATFGRTPELYCEDDETIVEVRFKDKGSLVQELTARLLRSDEGLLMRGRWKVLEKNLNYNSTWMVQDVWFSLPIVVAWRISLALCYIWRGLSYAGLALRGRS